MRRQFQRVEGHARIPIGKAGDRPQATRLHLELTAAQSPVLLERSPEQCEQVRFFQGLEHQNSAAGEQGRDDLEGRILGGGAHQNQSPVLDVGKERVLLSLVEAMDLVHEQHGAALPEAPLGACFLHHPFDLLDSRQDRADGDEVAVSLAGQQVRQGRLAHARGPPEQQGRNLARVRDLPQDFSGTQKVLLTDHLVQSRGTHSIGKGRLRALLFRNGRHAGEQASIQVHVPSGRPRTGPASRRRPR